MSAPDRQWSTRVEPVTCPQEFRFLTDGQKDQLLEEYEQGKSLSQLADQYQIDRSYLARILAVHSNPFVDSASK